MFKLIKDIDINNSQSWKDNIFLTFDIDWCSDDVLEYTLDILEEYNIKATFFVTHKTKLLERMRKNKHIELGIHPNFNPLLNGDFKYGKNINEVIKYYKNIVPEAVSARSHSLTSSSIISKAFKQNNLLYECNQYMPKNSNIKVLPYKHWEINLIIVPHFWEDDLHCIYQDKWDIDYYIKDEGIKVFDFHPIHLFLNTENLKRYEKSRNSFNDFNDLTNYKNSNYGIKMFLIELIKVNK